MVAPVNWSKLPRPSFHAPAFNVVVKDLSAKLKNPLGLFKVDFYHQSPRRFSLWLITRLSSDNAVFINGDQHV